jgi:hypothetical protein
MGALKNQVAGEVRIRAGSRLRFASPLAQHSNVGRIDVVGTPYDYAELEFEGTFNNNVGGLITARNSIVRFDRGLVNEGQLSTAVGSSEIYGDILNLTDGTIGVGGDATMSILGDLIQNGDLNILDGARAIVFGDFSGAGGTTGSGLLEVLGRTTIGNSPASVSFGGDLSLGAETLFELGGLAIGEFDQMNLAGDLTLGGDLLIEMWDGWQLAAGQSYRIANVDGSLFGQFNGLDEGDVVGTFNGHDLFISYTAGNGNDIQLISAIPEPNSAGLALVAFMALACSRRRKKRA